MIVHEVHANSKIEAFCIRAYILETGSKAITGTEYSLRNRLGFASVNYRFECLTEHSVMR